ncbi:MAG: hypothetical protein Q7R47_06195, partial [Candidatus Diapherotrites archaeon]|nr:hypothetical protein [Candidatus Diapherotrites archaeon]
MALPKFSSTQLFAILLVVVMVGSTLAIAIISGGNTNAPDTTQPLAPIDADNQTTLAFDATVNAKVFKPLNRLIFFGCTRETDIQKIDSRIVQLEGVSTANYISSFRQDASCEGLLYVAQFSYMPTVGPDTIAAQAQQSPLFVQAPFVLLQALVSVPAMVTFHNAAFDLNKTYTFPDPLLTAYVSSQTIANDPIELQISATFTGNTISQLQAYEQSNPALAKVTRQASRLWTVDLLHPLLIFSADTNYSAQLEPSVLTPLLERLPDVNGVQMAYQPTAPFAVQFLTG